jgi:hypothetical protein
LSKKDPLINEYYTLLWDKVNLAKNTYQCLQDENNRAELKAAIKELIIEMDQTLFKHALETIIHVFHCKLPLTKHNHINILEYNTPILVSEFIFAGFSKKFLQDIFDKILANTVNFDSKTVTTEAPLPDSLLALRETEDQKNFSRRLIYFWKTEL